MYQLIAMHIREISRPPVFIIVLDEHVSGDQRISQNPQPQGYTIDKEEEEGFEIWNRGTLEIPSVYSHGFNLLINMEG